MYITIQFRRAINSRRFFQRFNPIRVVLKTDTCRAETSCYASRRIIRANHSKSIVKLSEVHSTLVSRKHEVHVTLKVKDYATPIISKSKLIESSNISDLTFVVNKCNDIISSKFKAVKFTL